MVESENDRYAEARALLVARDLAPRGIEDGRVLQAMATVRRERFVPPELADMAYADCPLPIGSRQTISQPFIVAMMAAAAEIAPDHRVLEVGTGSGYGAAVLGCLAKDLWTIERHRSLAAEAAERLRAEGFHNVHVVVGDGTLGWPEEAPYDAIVVTASGPEIPTALCDQLAPGGRLIMPIGSSSSGQILVRVRREDGGYETDDLGAVRFVPLIGTQGW